MSRPAGGRRSTVPRRSGREALLTLAQAVNAVGDGAYFVCSALFFARAFHLSAGQVGLGLSVSWGVGALAGLAAGRLMDRLGVRPVAVALSLGAAVAVALLVVAASRPEPRWWAFLLTATAYAGCQCGLGAARQALVALLVPPSERTWLSGRLQAAVNASLALGALLGGAALALDRTDALVGVLVFDAVSFLAAAWLLGRLPGPDAGPAAAPPDADGERRTQVLRDLPYLGLSALNMVLLLRMPLLSVALPLWISTRTTAPTWLVAALFGVNTLAVAALQARVCRRVPDLPRAARALRRSGVLLGLSCLAFAASGRASPTLAALALLAGVLVQVAGELLQSAGSWQLSFELAPEGRHGSYQSVFGTGTAGARCLGPGLLVPLVVEHDLAGWLAIGSAFAVAGWLAGPVARRGQRRAAGRPGPPPDRSKRA